jgi:hypothetical protein
MFIENRNEVAKPFLEFAGGKGACGIRVVAGKAEGGRLAIGDTAECHSALPAEGVRRAGGFEKRPMIRSKLSQIKPPRSRND